MKKFDLEAARRGAAVCLVEGNDVVLVGISDATKTICGYVCFDGQPNIHTLWNLDGQGLGGTDKVTLCMRDDDYVERLAQGEYKIPDDGFIREIPKEKPAESNEGSADHKNPDEKTYVASPHVSNDAAFGALLGALFGSHFTSATRLRINIEYDGNPIRFDVEKAMDYVKKSNQMHEPQPSPKQEVSND